MKDINFSKFEEVKAAFPINSTIEIRGQTIFITGYYYDGYNWWPVNVVDGFKDEIKETLTYKPIRGLRAKCSCLDDYLVDKETEEWMNNFSI